jgi:DNA-binding NarL/FixJ family response regulator
MSSSIRHPDFEKIHSAFLAHYSKDLKLGEYLESIRLGLTEREKQILRLKKGNLSDYEIARKLRLDAGNVTRSRLTAMRKIERAQADLDFAL